MPFEKITMAGVGLLGGSLALAIRQSGLARVVAGFVRREAAVAECSRAGLSDFATTDLHAAVRDADLVVLCTPISQMSDVARRMAPALKQGTIVTDVGSVKGTVVKELSPIIARAGAEFIGAHPMAGGEKMGVSSARVDLFRGAVCVLTPQSSSNPASVAQLDEFWRAVGSRVLKLSPELHDQLVARCSHLPHLIAAQLASFVLDPGLPIEQPELCATGFRDTTRIASGSPEMWRDIAVANRENLAASLDKFISALEQIRASVRSGDAPALQQFFESAKQRRDAWCAQSASPSPE